MVQIWSVLLLSAILAGILVMAVGLVRARRRRPHGSASRMSRLERTLAILAAIFAVLAIVLPLGTHGETLVMSWTGVLALAYPVLVLILLALFMLKLPPIASACWPWRAASWCCSSCTSSISPLRAIGASSPPPGSSPGCSQSACRHGWRAALRVIATPDC